MDRILIAGEANDGLESPTTVARFLSDGSLDTSFGDSGYASIAFDKDGETCCMAIDGLDRIILAGEVRDASVYAYRFFFSRFTEAGRLDATFGNGGYSHLEETNGFLYSIVIDPSNRIFAAGSSIKDSSWQFTTLFLNVDGSLNKSLGNGGIYGTSLGFGDCAGTAITLDSLKRPVVAGFASDRDGRVPVLLRYDNIFGDGVD